MIDCVDCGTTLETYDGRASLCPACSKERRKARQRAYYRALPKALRLGRHDRPERAVFRRVTA